MASTEMALASIDLRLERSVEEREDAARRMRELAIAILNDTDIQDGPDEEYGCRYTWPCNQSTPPTVAMEQADDRFRHMVAIAKLGYIAGGLSHFEATERVEKIVREVKRFSREQVDAHRRNPSG